jgi:DNA-binding XRE family transcriptional regulator
VRRGGANRAGWFAHGRLVVCSELVGAVRAAFAWACEGEAQTLGVITFRPLRLALEGAYHGPSVALAAAWREAGQKPEVLADAVEALKPAVDLWRAPGRVLLLGHYQALRGLNLMADADALVTLGDPWPNLGEVRHACAVLGIDEWAQRFEAMARAELEQAHGRLRTIHRARPGRACHVGTLLPSGASWHPSAVDVRVSRGGRPKGTSALTPDEVRALRAQTGLSRARLAEELGCSAETLRDYEDGSRPVKAALASLLREFATSRSRQTAVSA